MGGWAWEGSLGGAGGEEDQAYVLRSEVGVGEAGLSCYEAQVGYGDPLLGVSTFEDAGGFFDGGGSAPSALLKVGVCDDSGWQMMAEGSEVRHGEALFPESYGGPRENAEYSPE